MTNERCADCGAAILGVLLDDRSMVLVDAMPALRGNVAARFADNVHGWRGYRLLPDRSAPPQHVTYAEHFCSAT